LQELKLVPLQAHLSHDRIQILDGARAGNSLIKLLQVYWDFGKSQLQLFHSLISDFSRLSICVSFLSMLLYALTLVISNTRKIGTSTKLQNLSENCCEMAYQKRILPNYKLLKDNIWGYSLENEMTPETCIINYLDSIKYLI
jgi:hypothetical protein